jgi:ATP-dependent phosphoenolpyruvate carboxykinase
VPELYEYAMQPETVNETNPLVYKNTITKTGALSVASGARTGRTPGDKRVVLDDLTRDVSLMET